MNEENQTNTTASAGAPKKKSGKAKKIIIAIIALIVIVAIVVIVLIATGVINLSDKGKMADGVDQLTESIIDPINKVADATEENGLSPKVFDNISEGSAIGVSTEVSANVEELSVSSLSSSEKSELNSIIDILNASSLGVDVRYDGDESAYLNLNGDMEDVEVSGEMVWDGEQLAFRSEELSETWLTVSKEDLEDAMAESGYDAETTEEALKELLEQMTELSQSINVDEETQKEIQERYNNVIKDYIDEKSEDIESEKTKVKVDGKEKSCEKIVLELDEDDIKDLLKLYVEAFQDDTQTQEILKDVLSAMYEMSSINDSLTVNVSADEIMDELISELDTAKDEIDNLDFEATVVLTVYATSTNVYRTDISFEADSAQILLESTFNENKTVIDISAKVSGAKFDIGTLTIESTDNSVSYKLEAGDYLVDNLGTEMSAEISYKVENSKAETTLSIDCGDYGYGTISAVTNVSKNEDSEYEDTTTLSIDVNVPSYITAKMSLIMKTNITVGNVSIPTISSSNSVDITDTEAVEEWATEAQSNAEDLIEKMSNIDVLSDIIEDSLY